MYVNVCIVLQFVLSCYFFFYLKTGDKFKTYSGIILSLLCCSQAKFKLKLYNEFLLVFVSLDMNPNHIYCSLFCGKTDNSD